MNLLSDVFAMPVALLVGQQPAGREILVTNDNHLNPYRSGSVLEGNDCIDELCELVINSDQMVTRHDLATNAPKADPANTSQLLSTFVGVPVHGNQGERFGVICIASYSSCTDRHSNPDSAEPSNQPPSNAPIPLNRIDYFRSLVESDLHMLDQLRSATDLSLRDDLTGVYNRRGFNILSQKQFFAGKRTHSKFAFMIVDLDQLKRVNDQFGHKTGDKAIVTVANALTNSLRECDLVARVGGDEFYIGLNLNQDAEISQIIARAEHYLQQHPIESGFITFSWGVSIRHYSDLATLSLESLVDEADHMLYQDKTSKNKGPSS